VKWYFAKSDPEFGPKNAEYIVYNEQTEMNSFLPIPQCEQHEIRAIQQQLPLKPQFLNTK